MRKKKLFAVLVFANMIWFLNACIDGHPIWTFTAGGITTIGSIKIYSMDKHVDELSRCIDTLYEKKIIFRPNTSSIYSGNERKIALFKLGVDTFAFAYQTSVDLNDTNKSIITLTHFGGNGQILEIDEHLNRNQKNILIDYFDDSVIPFIEKCQ
jgi:hypothetical protein